MVPCTRDMEIMPPAKAAMSLAEQVRRSFNAAIVRSIFEMRCSVTFMEPFFRFIVMPNQVISWMGVHTDFLAFTTKPDWAREL